MVGSLAAALAATACGEEETESKAVPLHVTVTESREGRLAYSAPRTVRAGLVEITLENRGKEPR